MSSMDFPHLSSSQREALDAFRSGVSMFVTGDAGTGKTELIRCMVQDATARGIRVAITATTGIAAVNVHGSTLHSFLKLMPDDQGLTKQEVVARIKSTFRSKGKYNPYLKLVNKIRCYRALIIDEVSMMDTDMFDKVDFLLREYFLRDVPFGGIQMVLVGDFFQLPPVYHNASLPKFIFQMPIFYEVFQRFELLEIFRQQDAFASLLRRMRRGILTPRDISILEERIGADVSIDGIYPTRLFSKNEDVDRMNASELSDLPGPEERFVSKSTYVPLPGFCEDRLETCRAKFEKDFSVGTLILKKGAQVLLTYNLDLSRGLCNGSRGVVETLDPLSVRFINKNHTDTVTVSIDEVLFTRIDRENHIEFSSSMIPLKLAWATTIHKSQGLSLDCVEILLDMTIFAEGQAYVAVSRARTLEGLSFKAFRKEAIRSSSLVQEFYSTPMAILKSKYV